MHHLLSVVSEIECVHKTFESSFVQKLEHCFQLYMNQGVCNKYFTQTLRVLSQFMSLEKLLLYFSLHCLTDNASLMCTSEGWVNKSDYGNCKPLIENHCDNATHPYLCNDYSMMIYSIGYTMSLVSLIIALIILLTLR